MQTLCKYICFLRALAPIFAHAGTNFVQIVANCSETSSICRDKVAVCNRTVVVLTACICQDQPCFKLYFAQELHYKLDNR